MNLVLFTVFGAFTLILSSSANLACYKTLNNYQPRPLTTKEAFQAILDKAFNELYNESAPHQPLTIEFCAKRDPKDNCMRLSPYNDTQCTQMAFKFTLENKLRTFRCHFPNREKCHIKCNVWIGDLNVTTIYNTGQTFNFKYGWGELVEAVLEIQDVSSAPIVKITNFKYGDNSDAYGFEYNFKSSKEKLPKGPCILDVSNAYKDVVFREEAVRDKLVKQ